MSEVELRGIRGEKLHLKVVVMEGCTIYVTISLLMLDQDHFFEVYWEQEKRELDIEQEGERRLLDVMRRVCDFFSRREEH